MALLAQPSYSKRTSHKKELSRAQLQLQERMAFLVIPLRNIIYIETFSRYFRGPKKHISFFNINSLDPHAKHLILGPQKKVYVPHFLGKGAKRDPHQLFRGDFFGVKTGVPNGPFSATRSLVYCFLLPLNFFGSLHHFHVIHCAPRSCTYEQNFLRVCLCVCVMEESAIT